MIRKEAWPFYSTSSGVRLCWELEDPKGSKWHYVGLHETLKDLTVLEILCCDPKGSRTFLRILSTKGRGVSLCWVTSKPRGPKNLKKSVVDYSSAIEKMSRYFHESTRQATLGHHFPDFLNVFELANLVRPSSLYAKGDKHHHTPSYQTSNCVLFLFIGYGSS